MTIPYGALERDLCERLSRKVDLAIGDAFSMTTSTGQAVLLGSAAIVASTAFAGAAFAVHHGHAKEEIDPIDVGIAILQATKEAKDDPNSAINGARNVLDDARRYREAPTYSATDLVARIGEVASAVAFQAGEPESELAGMILSTLVKRPDLVDRFMIEGSGLLVDGEIGPLTGVLSFRSIDGKIRRPEEVQ